MKIAYGVVTKGNGEAWITYECHTSLSLGGGQAGQGYPCVLVYDIDTEKILKREHMGDGNLPNP